MQNYKIGSHCKRKKNDMQKKLRALLLTVKRCLPRLVVDDFTTGVLMLLVLDSCQPTEQDQQWRQQAQQNTRGLPQRR